ncbi:unnamed protein product [Didymodactylos carnosus]|uniref:LamG-like jellyroll fold domain-containing protein n=1 Tax=Didymodactylos carnosus TaxID=1234261 RepID=A0A815SZ67_9BILA|nr:unnamed protein product [Didymodactylos carnosus]CAF1496779.1 unnamed protein product [Didymodactylos carnosus]CAF4155634.1 unnamed protein product [Didymodactylos carnosus]CAF4359187.1 unnamed protein product [Didymodactylos carnosus]
MYGAYNGIPINDSMYLSPGLTGYGSSLVLNGTLNQSVTVTNYINLTNVSFTFEAWIYLTVVSNADYSIFGQCELRVLNKCLHSKISNYKLYFGFFSNDLQGSGNLSVDTWYHVGFVYEYSTMTQSIYLNGVLDGSRSCGTYYKGTSGNLTIGTTNDSITTQYFSGRIDQVLLTLAAKTATEILDDATLTAFYSFDSGSLYDSGPNKINGSGFNTSVVSGKVGQAIRFAQNYSYFQITGLLLLGIPNQPYSLALWIKPTVSVNGTLIHTSNMTTGTGWCVPMLGLDEGGHIIVSSLNGTVRPSINGTVVNPNVWTHVAQTYGPDNGLTMYVNGALYGSTGSFAYAASDSFDTITIGNPLLGNSCENDFSPGQFYGAVDEFRLYSRELSAADVLTLANP